MLQVVFWVAVLAGFYFGGMLAGNIGAFGGGIGALAACLFGVDVLQEDRSADGFFLRHRGTFVEFLAVIIGVIVGQHFQQGFWGTGGGILAGIFGGQWLTNTLGWGGDSLDIEFGTRLLYLHVLHLVTISDGTPSQKEEHQLREAAKTLFDSLGFGSNNDIVNMIEQAKTSPQDLEIPAFVSELSREWQQQLLLDALRIIYSKRPVSHPKLQIVNSIFDWTGLQDRSLFTLFDRDAANSGEMRRVWLDELGLPPTADTSQIESAYRDVARKYHPDHLHDVPPAMVQLAKAKLAAANDAYNGLKNRSSAASPLDFRSELGESFEATENEMLNCCCWLCAKKNRVPAEANFGTARCGQCHALLGAVQSVT